MLHVLKHKCDVGQKVPSIGCSHIFKGHRVHSVEGVMRPVTPDWLFPTSLVLQSFCITSL